MADERMEAEIVDRDEQPPSRLTALLHRLATFYMGELAIAAASDRTINQKLFEVINLRRHPNSLVADPGLLARVLWARSRQWRQPAAADQGETPDHLAAPEGL